MKYHTQVEMKPIYELIPYEKNAKLHPIQQIEKLANHIRQFGWDQPIVVDENNVILKGHGRRLAALKLGIDVVPVIVLDGLSAQQKKAVRIADNKIAESGWDNSLLKIDLDELKDFGFDIQDLGFDFQEIPVDGMNNDDNNDDDDDDEFLQNDDETTKTVTQKGMTWILGNHRLHCGDSTNKNDVDTVLSGNKPELVFTDPPYELNHESVAYALQLSNCGHYVLICTFKQAAEIYSLKIFDFRFDFVINAHIPKSFMNSKQPYYTHQNGVYFSEKDTETIFDCKNTVGIRSENAYWHTIIDAPRNTQDSHGHAKNINGIIDVLSGFSAKTIFDMFGGSGSTLIACEKTGRKCYMIEIDEKYCDSIIKRWQKLTEKKAVLENDGRNFDDILSSLN